MIRKTISLFIYIGQLIAGLAAFVYLEDQWPNITLKSRSDPFISLLLFFAPFIMLTAFSKVLLTPQYGIVVKILRYSWVLIMVLWTFLCAYLLFSGKSRVVGFAIVGSIIVYPAALIALISLSKACHYFGLVSFFTKENKHKPLSELPTKQRNALLVGTILALIIVTMPAIFIQDIIKTYHAHKIKISREAVNLALKETLERLNKAGQYETGKKNLQIKDVWNQPLVSSLEHPNPYILYLTLVSKGPDGVQGTRDDISVSRYVEAVRNDVDQNLDFKVKNIYSQLDETRSVLRPLLQAEIKRLDTKRKYTVGQAIHKSVDSWNNPVKIMSYQSSGQVSTSESSHDLKIKVDTLIPDSKVSNESRIDTSLNKNVQLASQTDQLNNQAITVKAVSAGPDGLFQTKDDISISTDIGYARRLNQDTYILDGELSQEDALMLLEADLSNWIEKTTFINLFYLNREFYSFVVRIENILKEPVFLKGPHQQGQFNFYSKRTFGHYNPKFITKIKDLLFHDENDRFLKLMLKTISDKPFFKESSVLPMAESLCLLKQNPDKMSKYKNDYISFLNEDSNSNNTLFTFTQHWNEYTENQINEEINRILFWLRRDIDGTLPIFAQIITGLFVLDPIKNPQLIACLDDSDNPTGDARQDAKNIELDYFSYSSFVDGEEWSDASLLDGNCRYNLQDTFDAVLSNDDTRESVSITRKPDIFRHMHAAGCNRPAIFSNYYGLFQHEGWVTWAEVSLDFTLSYKQVDVCGETPNIALTITSDNGTYESEPILFSSHKPGTKGKGFYRKVPDVFTNSTEDGENKYYDLSDLGTLKGIVIESVEDTFCGECWHMWEQVKAGKMSEEDLPIEKVVSSVALKMKNVDGSLETIAESEGVGKYSYSDAYIRNIHVVDVNNDGWPDFLFDIAYKGRELVITKNGKVVKKIPIKATEYSGIGGC